jgi:AcrR family transcriptional regulator
MSDAPAVPPHEASVRERLLAAALTLFNERGYAATTVREIVEAAGVTKPVLYYHFQSKEGIYLHLMERGFTEFAETIRRAETAPGSQADRLRALFTATYRLFQSHVAEVRLMHAIYYGPPQGAPFFDYDAAHEQLDSAVRRIVDDGIASGEFRDGDAEAMTWAVIGCLNIAIELHLCQNGRAVPPNLALRALDAVLDGLLTPEKGSSR